MTKTDKIGDVRDASSIPGLGRFPGTEKWQPILGFLSGKSHGQNSLVGYSPWGQKSQTRLSGQATNKRRYTVTSKHVEKCSMLVIKETQIITTMSYHHVH